MSADPAAIGTCSATSAGSDRGDVRRDRGRYDLLNTVLRAGSTVLAPRAIPRWAHRPRGVLDVCTGTATSRSARRGTPARRVVGVDFAARCWRRTREGRERGLRDRIRLVRGDAMRLPVASGSVDAVTVAFGIRNVQHPDAACREILRVLRPGGRLAILEFGPPAVPAVPADVSLVFNNVLPRIGRAVSRHSARIHTSRIRRGLSLRRRVRSHAACRRIFTGRGPSFDVRHRLSLQGTEA